MCDGLLRMCAPRAAPRVRARGVHCARCSLLNEGSDTGGPSWFVAILTQWLRLWPLQYAPTAKQNVHARCRARGFADSIQCCVFRDQTGRTGDPCSRRSRRLSARASRLVLGTSFSHAITHTDSGSATISRGPAVRFNVSNVFKWTRLQTSRTRLL
jgi:hypothetical protein